MLGSDSLTVDADLLRSIFDSMPDAYFRTNLEGEFVLVNPSAALLYGYPSPHDLLGVRADLLYAEPGARATLLERLRETGRVEDFVTPARRRDGSIFWASVTAQLLRDPEGRVQGSEGYVRDVSARRAALEALRQSEARFQKAFEHSPDAIALNRMRDGLYIAVNQGFLELTGYERQELIGHTSLELNIWVNPADRQRLVRGLEAQGEVTNLEAWFRGKDGHQLVALMSAGVLDLDGEPHLLSVTRDISELRRIEAEKAELESRLRQVEKMESVGRLAGGVAHDFNNMLGVILGHTELALKDTDANASSYADLLAIQQAARRSADLTRQLLAFARKQTVARQVVDLNAVVREALKMLRRLIGEGVDLQWLPASDTLTVNVDPAQISQLLTNLCTNARDAMAGTGTLTIETTMRTVAAEVAAEEGFVPGTYVALRVRDTGTGMDAATRARLFEPYFTTKEMGKGTGLGLATVYGIVKQNDGFIEVESEPGRGTTLTIYLPRHAGEPSGLGDSEATKTATAERLGRETILLVEDEPSILALTARMLTMRGYRVLATSGAQEAVRVAREQGPIHLLITDVVMPSMNGRELAAQLRHFCPGIRCLFMSGYTADVIAHHGVLDAGLHFVQKPFSVAELVSKVQAVLDEA